MYLLVIFCFLLWLCCRNREDFCDCNWGSSVFADFYGLVHHQQHQTGDFYDKPQLRDFLQFISL